MKKKEKKMVDCLAEYYLQDYDGCASCADVVISSFSRTSISDKLLILSWHNPYRFWRVLTRNQSYLFKSCQEAKTFAGIAKGYGDFVCFMKYERSMH